MKNTLHANSRSTIGFTLKLNLIKFHVLHVIDQELKVCLINYEVKCQACFNSPEHAEFSQITSELIIIGGYKIIFYFMNVLKKSTYLFLRQLVTSIKRISHIYNLISVCCCQLCNCNGSTI